MKILMTEFVTHDVKRFIVEKPAGFSYVPGQATLVKVDKDGWREEERPFTFTSLNDAHVLEFTIKRYPQHNGVTDLLHTLKPGDSILFDEPWGTIQYKGTGTFLAGGAGMTPFIAIFRDLYQKDKLRGNEFFFSNKTARDIILEKELAHMFGDDLVLTLTQENHPLYTSGKIDKKFLEEHMGSTDQYFYICGPESFVEDLKNDLEELGVASDNIVIEE